MVVYFRTLHQNDMSRRYNFLYVDIDVDRCNKKANKIVLNIDFLILFWYSLSLMNFKIGVKRPEANKSCI